MEKIGLQQSAAAEESSVPEARKASGGAVDTVVSAALFGALGATIGHWIGVRCENAERQLARPFLTWVGGVFFAVLAGFTSWQLSRRRDELAQTSPAPESPVVKNIPETAVQKPVVQGPASQVQAAQAEHLGAMQEAQLQRV